MKKIAFAILIAGLAFLAVPVPELETDLGAAPTRPRFTRTQVLNMARKYIGVPYVYGGESPRGFDCSGYTKYVFGRLGIKLPHSSRRQFKMLRPTSKLRPGDLVFYRTYTPNVSHVGIYVGGNRFLHAPSTGKRVRYTNMRYRYWRKRYAGARTVFKGVNNDPGKEDPKTDPQNDPKKDPKQDPARMALLNFELIKAVYNNQPERVSRYLQRGADPSAIYKKWSVLMLAVDSGHERIASILVKAGAKVNFALPSGWTALGLARYHKNKRLEKMLMDAGAVRTRSIPKRRRVIPQIRWERF